MKQVKEELEKGKAVEARRTKEVAQLRKEQVRKEGLIRNLEKEKRQKEAVLKRKQEEVNLYYYFFAADFAEFVGVYGDLFLYYLLFLWACELITKEMNCDETELLTSYPLFPLDFLLLRMAFLKLRCTVMCRCYDHYLMIYPK